MIGRCPFDAPSALDFLEPDYVFPDMAVSEAESAPESESKPAVEAASKTILAPESQVFTSQYSTSCVNVMLAIIL